MIKFFETILIAITGGPCAGKTTIINKLTEIFGKQIIIVKEVASHLLENGLYPVPDPWTQEWQDGFQTAIIRYQEIFEAEAIEKAKQSQTKLIICDRGLLDGAAYLANGVNEFCQKFNVSEDKALSRYQAIIHLESLATLDPTKYIELIATNPARFEGLDMATERELKLRQAWSRHPSRHHITGPIDENKEKIVSLLKTYL